MVWKDRWDKISIAGELLILSSFLGIAIIHNFVLIFLVFLYSLSAILAFLNSIFEL